ncbi:GNAT family N-acetyltransferase [Actinokineospora soli]|uniref:GNAT family N-acetyltransferase n=1 Tax=Actinokineospora soli TaxID=1048753 RepID=A0ABW2TJU2_9PSEU
MEKVEKLCASGLWVAEIDGEPVGVLAVGTELQEWIPPADEPELYVRLLVSSRRHAGNDIGGALLRHARELARADGVDLLRVDCWAGDNGRLVGYYVRQGFTPTATFTVGEWPGQVLAMRP